MSEPSEPIRGTAYVAPAASPPPSVFEIGDGTTWTDLGVVSPFDADLFGDASARFVDSVSTSGAALSDLGSVVLEVTITHVHPMAAWLLFDEWSPRRWRRIRTHVWEQPERSRMHATYRAKTRRRNRR